MDLSKLDSNEKLATYGALASIAGAILATIGFGGGVLWLTLLLAIAMLAIIFMPQWSPSTQLPGSKGSLMLIVGGIAGVSAILALLSLLPALGFFGLYGGLWFVGLLLGIVGGLMMGWASWQAFQAEGGKFQIGTASSGEGAATTTAPPAATPAPPAATTAPAAEPTPAADPATHDETGHTHDETGHTHDDSPENRPTS